MTTIRRVPSVVMSLIGTIVCVSSALADPPAPAPVTGEVGASYVPIGVSATTATQGGVGSVKVNLPGPGNGTITLSGSGGYAGGEAIGGGSATYTPAVKPGEVGPLVSASGEVGLVRFSGGVWAGIRKGLTPTSSIDVDARAPFIGGIEVNRATGDVSTPLIGGRVAYNKEINDVAQLKAQLALETTLPPGGTGPRQVGIGMVSTAGVSMDVKVATHLALTGSAVVQDQVYKRVDANGATCTPNSVGVMASGGVKVVW